VCGGKPPHTLRVLRGTFIRTSFFSRFVIVLGLLCAVFPMVAQGQGRSEYGLGGSSRLTPDTVLPFSPEVSTRYQSSALLQNVGRQPLKIVLSSNLPVGVTVEPLIEMPFVMRPGESREVPFAIQSGEGLVDGLYDGLITLGAEADGPLPPGTTFLPGFSIGFRVNIIGGEPGELVVRSINSDDGKPAFGTLSLYYIGPTNGNTLIDSVEGSELLRKVPPGKYRAEFTVQGLTNQDVTFDIAAGEKKEVIIEINGITFLVTTAKPRGSDGNVDAALLTMAVFNNLRRFVGPAKFLVDVKRNGKLVEQFQLTEFAELPEGLTEQQSTYIPPGGFKHGTWTFEFSLATPEYTVRAAQIPSFEIPWRFGGLPLFAWVVIAALLAAAAWWFFVYRRRREDDEEHSERTKRWGG